MIYVPLVLGDVEFNPQELEVPETIGSLAGLQSIAQHDFPGGYRTHQAFGYFPQPVAWNARFSGGDASDRVEAVKRILYAGQEVQLTWGERAWLGRLAKFTPRGRTVWMFEYECEFWPRIDISSGQSDGGGAPDPQMVLNLQMLALQSALTADATTFFPNVMATLSAPILALTGAVTVGLIAAGGSVAALAVADQIAIGAASEALIGACAPLQAVIDATIASPAADIAAAGAIIGNVVASTQAAMWSVVSINPNLMLLSAQYYGDATLWQTIADANGLADPMPIGSFTLNIPQPA